MNVSQEGLLSAWPMMFLMNCALGSVLVFVYASIRWSFKTKRPEIDSLLIGILFGCSAIVSMTYPIRTAEGLTIDARNMFVLVGSLFGGPIGAALATVAASVYRLEMGGPGALPSVITIVASGLIGTLFNRRYGDRVRDLTFLKLVAIGLLDTAVMTGLIELIAALQGIGGPPVLSELASLVIFPLGTAVLGIALGMTHYRVWWQLQQRLADIVENTSDLVWETDADARFTFISGRYREMFGRPMADILGHKPDEIGLTWADKTALRTYAEARSARKPFVNLVVNLAMKDGSAKVISNSGRPVFDIRGQFAGYRGTAADITERKRMEEDLKQASEHLARAQRVGRTCSGEIDLRTGRLYWSEELFRLLGLDPQSSVPDIELFFGAIHAYDRDRIRHQTKLNRSGVNTEDCEFRITRPDGELRWLLRSSEVTRDAAGTAQTVFTNFLDITDRKHAEAELNRSREHLERVQSVARIGSSEVDLKTQEVKWSDEIYRLLGIDRNAIQPGVDSFAALVHPADRDMVRDVSVKGRKGVDVDPIEFRVTGLDGTIRWFYRTANLVRDADGRATRLIATMYDTTERRAAENALRESEQRFAVVFRDSPVGIAITDLSGSRGFVEANHSWLSVVGFERDEVIGRTGLDLNIWPDPAFREAIYNAISTEPGIWNGETQFRRKDGAIVDIAMTMRRIDIGGKPFAAAISYEITDRKRAEQALRQAHAELEERVRERTKELADANQRLLVSSAELDAARKRSEDEKKRAEAANEAKSDFLARVSHELRTPLNAVLGFAQLLELNTREPLTAKQARQVAQIRKSGDHLLSLIDEILDLSKIETGTIRVSIERVALGPIFDHVRATLQPLADSAGLDLVFELAPNIPAIRADRVRLMQILMNLGTNAIKYNKRGGSVSLVAHRANDDSVVIEVTDTGVGIPLDRHGEVFQPFNRLGAEGGGIEGSGIGLAISHRLTELMNGRLSFHSQPGRGSTFVVELPVAPLKAGESVETDESRGAAHAALEWTRDVERHTLLYVEDNPPNIALMQELVDSVPSLRLLTAADANTGLALAHAHQPDVIVLDINLPGMNGFEILKRLKRAQKTGDIPVMALSAAALPNDIERGKAAGFSHYLTKPIDVQEFLHAIESVLKVGDDRP